MAADKVLIVDDNEENVLYLSEILEEHGYAHAVARNGAEALEAMQASLPRLVLLDIFMPRKSGVLVYQQMKRDPQLQGVPIIIVTGASSVTGVDLKTGEQQPKQDAGDDFARGMGEVLQTKLEEMAPEAILEKPVDAAELVRRIEEVLA